MNPNTLFFVEFFFFFIIGLLLIQEAAELWVSAFMPHAPKKASKILWSFVSNATSGYCLLHANHMAVARLQSSGFITIELAKSHFSNFVPALIVGMVMAMLGFRQARKTV